MFDIKMNLLLIYYLSLKVYIVLINNKKYTHCPPDAEWFPPALGLVRRCLQTELEVPR